MRRASWLIDIRGSPFTGAFRPVLPCPLGRHVAWHVSITCCLPHYHNHCQTINISPASRYGSSGPSSVTKTDVRRAYWAHQQPTHCLTGPQGSPSFIVFTSLPHSVPPRTPHTNSSIRSSLLPEISWRSLLPLSTETLLGLLGLSIYILQALQRSVTARIYIMFRKKEPLLFF